MVTRRHVPSPAPAPSGQSRVRLLVFGAVALAATYVGFLAFDVNEARVLVQRYGYYGMALTFGWALFVFARNARQIWFERPSLTRSECGALVGVVMALTLLAVVTVPYTYKVLYDEFVLQATAQYLHQAREVGTVIRGYDVEGSFQVTDSYLDKRPVFFAFLVSLLHDVTGYREANAFALNTALLPAILGLFYWLARRVAPHRAALAAVVALGAFSLLAQNATGAGMELLNLALLLVVVLLAIFYLEEPDGPRLSALILAAVLLAQTRYESGLYIAPVALVILEGWRRRGAVLLPWTAVLAPALLIPYALQNTYVSGTPFLWELRDGAESRFAAEFLPGNLWHATRFFFNFTASLPNSWWLGVAGLPALAWAGVSVARRLRHWRAAAAPNVVLVVFGAAICANLALLMAYYWGELDDPIVSRLSLPFCTLLALCLGWAAMQVPERWRGRATGFVAAGALFAYGMTGLRTNATHWEINLLMREIAWEWETVAQRPPARRLIISNKSPLPWLTREVPSLAIGRARWRAEAVKFHRDHHTFDEVLVMQIYRPIGPDGGFQLEPEDRLPAAYVLEPVAERRFGSRLARISRVAEIRLDAEPAVVVNPVEP
ncbi:MAG: hypothetical protein Q8M02_06950 [Candidatus Didemnitutus sp.]|nr:hypothetical protein [Candidatus Didemnitutus sp.]